MLTFVIPVGNYHRDIAERAVESVLAQPIACAVVVVYDADCKGAGWARNRGLERVHTPFVSFLDADDTIAPDFAEKCLLAYDGRHFVYTDWLSTRAVQVEPCRWNTAGQTIITTTLLPTAFVRHIGGFDEALTGGEDTDFYYRVKAGGLCPKRVPEVLFTYGADGQRSLAFRKRPDHMQMMRSVMERYKGVAMPQDCGGCGGAPNPDAPPVLPANQSFDGAVLATALWAGNRQERGRMTGMTYPRTGNGKKLFVHERDIDAAPHLFARVVELPPPVTESDLAPFRQFFGSVVQAFGGKAPVLQEPVTAGVPRGEVEPDIQRVLRLFANVAKGENAV